MYSYYIKTQTPQKSCFARLAALDEFVHQILSGRFCGENPGRGPDFLSEQNIAYGHSLFTCLFVYLGIRQKKHMILGPRGVLSGVLPEMCGISLGEQK